MENVMYIVNMVSSNKSVLPLSIALAHWLGSDRTYLWLYFAPEELYYSKTAFIIIPITMKISRGVIALHRITLYSGTWIGSLMD